MKNYYKDTIIAIATPPGQGGIGILRISGKSVPTIFPKLFKKIPKPRTAEYLSFLSYNTDTTLEKVIALFFPEPHSFTGENVLEIHAHGGQMMLDLLLKNVLQTSDDIRIANPGEFTERAFLNGKIDLIQAEAIADIINANSHQAAKSASNSLQGAFSKKIKTISDALIELRIQIESEINFPEEEINSISYKKIHNDLKNIINNVKETNQLAHHGLLLYEGIKVVFAGKPNSGKSSLFNQLIEKDRAITSAISGTTRDTLHEKIQIQGVTFNIVDTAGIKKNSRNEIEKIGIQRAWNELLDANHILWVIDSNKNKIQKNYDVVYKNILKNFNNKTNFPSITIIRNKSDLSKEPIGINTTKNYTIITVSALLNDGIHLLQKHLTCIKNHKKNNRLLHDNQNNFTARRRHLHALQKTYQYLLMAQKKLLINKKTINELFAEDIKLANHELNTILGKTTSDDLLKKIFSKFCIGK